MPALDDFSPAELAQLREELRGRREAADREARGAARRAELEERERERRAEFHAAAEARRRAREGRDADAREAAARADGEARAEARGHEREFHRRHGEESFAVGDAGVNIFATGATMDHAGGTREPPADPGARAGAVYSFHRAKYDYLAEQYRVGRADVVEILSMLDRGARVPPPTDDQYRWLEAAAGRVREAREAMLAAWREPPAAARQRDRDHRDAGRKAELRGHRDRLAALPVFGG